ncbi:hypothetical protein C8Q72DRAFT_656222 [Fomitopsis betulina]|nr:hypothetical protein C8Q72DRAFT_656222 [Fomitopsis betulina]
MLVRDTQIPTPDVVGSTIRDGQDRRQHALESLRSGFPDARIQRADTPVCEQCGAAPETVHHFLRECPAYDVQRERLDGDAGEAATQLRTLLNTPRMMSHLFRYIHDTQRFHSTYGDLTPRNPTARPELKNRTRPGD